jgi:hypothetical protein
MNRYLINILLGAAGCFLVSCAPLFSDLQSARLVGKKQFEVTPGYSSVGFAADKSSKQGVANYLGFQFAYGLSENVDLRFRFEHSWIKKSFEDESENGVSYNVVAFGPKINLVRNRVALFLPVGTTAGLTIQFQPTFLFTIPLTR